MIAAAIREHPDGVQLSIRVHAGAKRSKVGPERSGRLRVAVTAPALEGRANVAVLLLLSDTFGLRKSSFSLIRGDHHRDKEVLIVGIAPDTLADHLC